MPPRENLAPSTIGLKYAANRDAVLKNGDMWLADKRNDDGAEGLWRIHDDLYDLTDYVDRHPGGKMWLELTKGTDITEAFEVHHILKDVTKILPKYYVRKASAPRHSPFTFKDDGFYRTLKRNVRETMKDIPKENPWKSHLLIDSMLAATFILSTLAVSYQMIIFAVLAGYTLCCTTVMGHNYFHKKDNFRMYYFDVSMLESREWRISHVLSHHILTNTIYDLEISLFEPFLEYLPTKKSLLKKILSWIAAPIVYLILFHFSYLKKILLILSGNAEHFRLPLLIPFILPTFMYIFGGQSLYQTLSMWTTVISLGSVMFAFVGLNAAHHHPDIFHDGDFARENKDWGINQLDAVMDRKEITGSFYLVMTNFGDHALHHMFPTLDHGMLHKLYPVFKKTCKDFGIDFRMTSQLDLIKGGFQQLIRETPNPNPPDLLKYSKDK